ncbi:DDE Tnp4 domain-containing protein [Aphis craccivora]|uniref:DDE Tnp4 domain-containing protein n=1 Tax=Aphis craccivora TaxID=307492 RepID=A0A6G0YV64_APHCR|nr:DDE Tnp4 domain-containing protein [Aphis craccivora]
MAIVDLDYKFICVDVGGYGRNSDGGILEESVMGKRLEAGILNVQNLQSRSNTRLDTYNYRLCRARRVVENTFGILSKKWRVYKGPIELKEETTIKVILVTCILHNYLRVKNCDIKNIELDEDQWVIRALEEVDVNK